MIPRLTSSASRQSRVARLQDLPELNVAIFAFLLNFVWEMWQIPFYQDMLAKAHGDGVWQCTRATFGDVLIMLVAFGTVAVTARSRCWILQPSWPQLLAFVAVGVLITVGMEEISTRLDRWTYADIMPILPLLGTGVLPLVQWVVIPPLVVWFVRRQLN